MGRFQVCARYFRLPNGRGYQAGTRVHVGLQTIWPFCPSKYRFDMSWYQSIGPVGAVRGSVQIGGAEKKASQMKLNNTTNLFTALLFGAALSTSSALAGNLTLEITSQYGTGTYHGADAAPYVLSVTDSHGHNSSVLAACDDYNTRIDYNDPWSGNAFTLSAANLSKLKFSSIGLIAYEEAAVIFTDVKNNPSMDVAGSVVIWSLFEPGSVNVASVFGAQAELNHAAALVAAGGLNYSGITIYTPTPLRASQEFITGSVTPTPEPTTYAMMGGGLILLGWARRRVRGN